MQSCLEKRGREERKLEITKNCYTRSYSQDSGVGDENYSVMHPNALSDGDGRGKGTRHGGHTTFRPHEEKNTYAINYSNFDTMHGGSKDDENARNSNLIHNIYGKGSEYSYNMVKNDENK